MTQRSEREAILWHDRLEQDRSPETLAAFEEWRRSDSRNAHAFEQQVRLGERLPESRFGPVRPRRALRAVTWPGLATVGAVAVALVALWPRADPVGRGPLPSFDAPRLMLTRPVRLADGSLVVLASEARVTPEPHGARRRVRLSGGSARFIVAPDPEPFVALAGPVSVVSRRTVFDIDLTDGRPRVKLLEGTAAVSGQEPGAPPRPPVDLAPGQALDPGVTAPGLAAPGSGPRLGPLEVDDMALADVLAIAERGAGTRVALADPALGARRVTGRFHVGDARALARKLAVALDLAVNDSTGRVTLRPR